MKTLFKEKSGNSIINGALILTLSTMIVKILGLVYKVPLSYILSDEGMGYFNTAYTVYTFFYVICTAGVPKAISVITAERIAKGNDREAERVCLIAFRVFFLIGALSSILFIIFSPLLAKLIGSEKSSLTMLSIAPSIAFVSASGALRGYFNGKIKLLPIAVSEVIAGVSKLVLGLLFAHIAYSYNMELYQISAFSILGITIGSFLGFIYLYFIKKKDGNQRQRITHTLDFKASYSVVKSILKIAIPITLTSAIGSLINLLDVGVVMRMLEKGGFTELQANIIYGNYTTLVIPMFNLVATILAPISVVLLPLLTHNTVSGENSEFINKTKISTDIALFVTIPISFAFMFYSDSILKFIFEDSSAAMAAPLLSVLAPSVVFMGLLLVINTGIEGKGNFKIPLISLTLGSLLKLLISFLLISRDNFNIIAAPIGTALSYALGFLISYIYLVIKEHIKIPILKTSFFTLAFSFCALMISKQIEKLLEDFENWYFKYIFVYASFFFVYVFFILIYIFISKKRAKVYNYDKKQ